MFPNFEKRLNKQVQMYSILTNHEFEKNCLLLGHIETRILGCLVST